MQLVVVRLFLSPLHISLARHHQAVIIMNVGNQSEGSEATDQAYEEQSERACQVQLLDHIPKPPSWDTPCNRQGGCVSLAHVCDWSWALQV